MTTTSQGLPLPTVDVSAARSAALRLRQASNAAEQCLDHLDDAAPADWIGQASQAYLDGRAVVSRRATDLAQACAVLDRAVVAFSQEVGAVLPRWRPAAERLQQLELTCSDPARAGLVDPAPGQLEALVRERDDLRVEVAGWERRYGEATLLLSGACSRVMAIVDDGVLSTGDQLWAIPETVVRQLVVEPLDTAALLVEDPSQADDVARAAWFGLVDQVRNPRRTAEEMAGVPAYRDGRWGEGLGTTGVSVIGFWGLRRLIADLDAGRYVQPDGTPTWPPPPGSYPLKKDQRIMTLEEVVTFRRNIDIRDLTTPIRTQTLAEMQADLDLTRSEHPANGHTISRHIEVDDAYLEFRLRQGTPENDGRLSAPPTEVSRWTDLSTAEATIQEALLDDDNDKFLAAVAGPANGRTTLTVTEPGLGEVWKLGPPGPDGTPTILRADASEAELVITRNKGMLFIQTTLLSAGTDATWTSR